jgi:Tfp pilus assembly protein PilX
MLKFSSPRKIREERGICMLDIAMIVILVLAFISMKLIVDWVDKQINK